MVLVVHLLYLLKTFPAIRRSLVFTRFLLGHAHSFRILGVIFLSSKGARLLVVLFHIGVPLHAALVLTGIDARTRSLFLDDALALQESRVEGRY